MADQLQLRGGTTSEHSTFTGALREVTVDTDKDVLVVHDNSTAGGHPLMAEDGSNSALALGSAGTPSLKFTGDTNTGVFSPGADTVGVSTGGTERIRIDSSGNVGLGTTSPAAILHSNPATANGAISPAFLTTQGGSGAGTGTSIRLGYSSIDGGYSEIAGAYNDPGTYLQLRTSPDNSTAATTRLHITASGNVGIGTDSPDTLLNSVGGVMRVSGTRTAGAFVDINADNTGSNGVDFSVSYYGSGSYGPLRFGTGGAERARIDSSGRLLVGTSTGRSWLGVNSFLQVEATGYQGSSQSWTLNSNSADGVYLGLTKSRGSTLGSNTLVSSGDTLGAIYFNGTDGSVPREAASILVKVDGTPGATDMPGRIEFSTTADGASGSTERMRIWSTGSITFGTTNELPASNNVAGASIYRGEGLIQLSRPGDSLALNRSSTDGNLVLFLQDGTLEGSISVSGTTVSYNGAHLARWSQLPGGVERTEILRGTVLSNIDEMCDWGDEDNEQLNRMKVSDVEGDKNVSGVFQAWDDDDDTYTNDFYCAMTGDFVIRIAQGVTVERGDLLMSAGDGTAKPQDDDIIRSKTIAKVTSTHVSETYADGSYCVPCVLMAC